MIEVVGVRFRPAGKVYYFNPDGLELSPGTHVIVETANGVECGTIVMGSQEVEEKDIEGELKIILRKMTDEDRQKLEKNQEKEKEAYKICAKKIKEHKLDMKLITAEYTFDHSKLLFYFSSEGRVDFRNLVKDLASVFRTRIELRQIGVRDEAKFIGGLGICGRELCCGTFLTEFNPVSIKMAKEQGLSLNPSKISGVCGRLMCCLKNEQATYEYYRKQLPTYGQEVKTVDGITGRVKDISTLAQKVKITFKGEDGAREVREYHKDELTVCPMSGKKCQGCNQKNNNNNKNDKKNEKKNNKQQGKKRDNRKSRNK